MENLVCNQCDYLYNFNFAASNLLFCIKSVAKREEVLITSSLFLFLKFFYAAKVESGSIMNRKAKKFVIIKITQIIFFLMLKTGNYFGKKGPFTLETKEEK